MRHLGAIAEVLALAVLDAERYVARRDGVALELIR